VLALKNRRSGRSAAGLLPPRNTFAHVNLARAPAPYRSPSGAAATFAANGPRECHPPVFQYWRARARSINLSNYKPRYVSARMRTVNLRTFGPWRASQSKRPPVSSGPSGAFKTVTASAAVTFSEFSSPHLGPLRRTIIIAFPSFHDWPTSPNFVWHRMLADENKTQRILFPGKAVASGSWLITVPSAPSIRTCPAFFAVNAQSRTGLAPSQRRQELAQNQRLHARLLPGHDFLPPGVGPAHPPILNVPPNGPKPTACKTPDARYPLRRVQHTNTKAPRPHHSNTSSSAIASLRARPIAIASRAPEESGRIFNQGAERLPNFCIWLHKTRPLQTSPAMHACWPRPARRTGRFSASSMSTPPARQITTTKNWTLTHGDMVFQHTRHLGRTAQPIAGRIKDLNVALLRTKRSIVLWVANCLFWVPPTRTARVTPTATAANPQRLRLSNDVMGLAAAQEIGRHHSSGPPTNLRAPKAAFELDSIPLPTSRTCHSHHPRRFMGPPDPDRPQLLLTAA